MIRRIGLAFALSLALISSNVGCASAGLKPPAQFNLAGDASFYSWRLGQLVGDLQVFAVEGQKAGAISTEDTRQIMDVAAIVIDAGKDLQKSIDAGATGATAKQQAVNAISEALRNLPAHLKDPGVRAQVEIAAQGILFVLGFFGGA